MTALDEEVLEIINTAINGKYLGRLKVVYDEKEDYYTLLLGLNQEQAPLHLGHPGPEDEFKKFIYNEMKRRGLHKIRRWQGYMTLPDPEYCDDEEWEGYEFPVIPF